MSFNKLYAGFFLDSPRFCVISHNDYTKVNQIVKLFRESYEEVHVSMRRLSCCIGFYKL